MSAAAVGADQYKRTVNKADVEVHQLGRGSKASGSRRAGWWNLEEQIRCHLALKPKDAC